jgi:hypothetical protein
MFAYLENDNNVSNYSNPSIPATQLGYNTNNRFPEFPPLMQDGRSILSSWQPEAVINDRILKNNGIKSNWEYRRFLSQNAKEILNHNFQEACNDTGYNMVPPYSYADVPYRYEGIEDTTVPLGVQTSDLKQLYLSREQLDARNVAPQISQADLLALRNFRSYYS